MNGSPKYGFSKIWIKPQWLACTPAEREEAIAHELAHVVLLRMNHFTEQLIDTLIDEDTPFHTFTYNQFVEALETTTQDLAESMVRNSQLLTRSSE
jgi:hypothetical protein